MTDHIARLALTRMNNREMLIAEHYTGFLADMRSLAQADASVAEAAFAARRAELVMAYGLNPIQQAKPFAFSQGIAIIPVHGTLINRFGYSWSYVTGYNFIRQQTALAGMDPDVLGIVYDVNTYGGEAAGCFECSDDIRKLANGKPTMSLVDSNCYSAGMALASGTDRIVCTPSGGVGSVGVVAMHVDMSKMLEDIGIKITFIKAGAHKVDGNPYEELPDSVKADMQKSIDVSYKAFVALVSKGRGMEEKAVRATEARTYRADDAMSVGFIDAIAAPNEAMQAFLGELSGSNSQPRKKEDEMSEGTKPGATNQATPEQLAQAAATERTRISGIQTSEEAKGRSALASHLAFNTSMSVDEAKAVMAAAPKEAAAPAAAVNPLHAAMAASKNPNVGADAADGEPGEMSEAAMILKDYSLATGHKSSVAK